jgi:hypothetical protein
MAVHPAWAEWITEQAECRNCRIRSIAAANAGKLRGDTEKSPGYPGLFSFVAWGICMRDRLNT